MKKTVRKYLSVFLAVAMLVTTLLPMGAYAAKSMAAYIAESVTGIASYSTFIEKLKILDRYAVAYAQEHNADATLLEITYIRTGVEKYNDDQWEMLAGKANTDFIEYVAQEDAKTVPMPHCSEILPTLHCPMARKLIFAICLQRLILLTLRITRIRRILVAG